MNKPNDSSLARSRDASDLVSGIEAMTTEQIFAFITTTTASTLENYRKLAEAIKVLDDRGVDLTPLMSNPLIGPLRKVGHHQLSLDAVARLKFSVLKHVERLPLPIQEQAADPNFKFTIVATREDGQVYKWDKPACDMTAAEAKRVFAKDHVRLEAEQIQMDRLNPPRRNKTATTESAKISLDKRRGGLVFTVGGEQLFVDESEILQNLARLRA